mmetsp:Transcript_2258/g.8980  ORF Transcript_2258/g.8980 Transcript_2258/m.8980 type:complete len:243 (-) Transcript_2258:870-1598(-)
MSHLHLHSRGAALQIPAGTQMVHLRPQQALADARHPPLACWHAQVASQIRPTNCGASTVAARRGPPCRTAQRSRAERGPRPGAAAFARPCWWSPAPRCGVPPGHAPSQYRARPAVASDDRAPRLLLQWRVRIDLPRPHGGAHSSSEHQTHRVSLHGAPLPARCCRQSERSDALTTCARKRPSRPPYAPVALVHQRIAGYVSQPRRRRPPRVPHATVAQTTLHPHGRPHLADGHPEIGQRHHR